MTVGEYIIKLRKAVKHPHSAKAKKEVMDLVDTSIDRLFKQVDVSKLTVLAPLGSSSPLNMLIAKKIKSRLGGNVYILEDVIEKNTWKNVKLSKRWHEVMAGTYILKMGPNKGKPASKAGAIAAQTELEKFQSKNPDGEFHVHDLRSASLRQYFSEFYKTKEGGTVDLITVLNGARVLIIDDTLESGTTYFESLRVLKEFQPSAVSGFIFLWGRGTG